MRAEMEKDLELFEKDLEQFEIWIRHCGCQWLVIINLGRNPRRMTHREFLVECEARHAG